MSRRHSFKPTSRAGARCDTRSELSLAVLAALGALVCTMPTTAAAQAAGSILPRGTVPVLRGIVSGQAVVAAPVATATGSKLTITQQTPQVVIDWKQFNIANGSEVFFDQASSTYAALNRIYSADPSIIQGKLSGKGQIFLINQNGILFDRGAQINVNTLYASTLNIANDRFAKGVAGAAGTTDPAFAGGYDDTGNTVDAKTAAIEIGRYGSASAAAPAITAASGGAIVLIAPMINNQSGVISSPDGQVILAAGSKAYLQFPVAADSTLRGLIVQIDADDGPVNVTSLINNAGTLQADRGNVTLAGLAVNQNGRISATTALQRNGSIFLQASTNGDARRGTVTLGLGSVTETPLDATDKSTLTDSQSYDPYRAVVDVTAATIVDNGVVRSPAGNVQFNAQDPTATAAPRIYLGASSVIDVSGDVATIDHASDFATFKVTSNELANSPDQKSGILKGATVTVDLRQGSSLLDISGYQANRPRTLQEKASSAGSVTLASGNTTFGGDLIQRAGSVIDASAGSIVDPGGISKTTELLGADGKVYNIATAPEQLGYTSLLDSVTLTQSRWGQTESVALPLFTQAVFEPGSRLGANGGSITLAAHGGMVVDGSLLAGTTAGATQLADAPRAGSLAIGDFAPPLNGAAIDYGTGNVVFMSGSADTLGTSFTATSPLSASRADTLFLSTDLFAASGPDASGRNYAEPGFGSVTIGANGRISLPRGLALDGNLGGALSLSAQQIDIEGSISVPAGSIALNAVKTVGTPTLATASNFIELGGSLSAVGQWSNAAIIGGPTLPSAVAAVGSATATATPANHGGAVSLNSTVLDSQVDLAAGSVIDVSGGGSVSATGKIAGGNAGSIAIVAAANIGGDTSTLSLAGQLLGYSLTQGASLAITTSEATIGGATDARGVFSSAFFDRGGFASYSVNGVNGLTLPGGTLIQPLQQNYLIDNATALALPSGASLTGAAQIETLPDYQRDATSLALAASFGSLNLETGAVISMDPKAQVTLKGGAGGVEIDANISAPGGAITLSDAGVSGSTASLHIGEHAKLDVSSGFVPAAPTALGLRQGTLLGGGTISINASNASLVADAGSVLNVSGASQVIDQVVDSTTQAIRPTTVTSDAGLVSIQANDQFQLGATLLGHAQGDSAGGSFALTYNNRNDFLGATSGRRIVVTDAAGGVIADPAFTDAAIATVPLRSGGFDKLRLTAENQIDFQGPVVDEQFARGVTLDSQQFKVEDGTHATVRGAAVTLANSYGQRVVNADGSTALDASLPSLPVATDAGTGLFDVRAGTLALSGSLTLSGVAETRLLADNDITLTGRVVGIAANAGGAALVGGLVTVGDIALQSAQMYPTTKSSFTIAVQDGLTGTQVPGGAVTIAGNGATQGEVLSAGGSLTIAADRITQGGTLKAPLGTLALDAGTTLALTADSTTSVSANGLVIPFGGTAAGVNWLYASTNADPLLSPITAPPAKGMSLTGKSIDVQHGATVDVSGGGNILGIEFVPGSGGAVDALAQPNTYALLPAAQLKSVPVDTAIALTQNLGGSSDGNVYNSIHIASNGAVPAGDYVLLPGYYALLPGAYLLQVQSGSAYAQLQPGQSSSLGNGQMVLPAWRTVAGTDVRSSQTIGVVVRPGTDATTLADYNLFNADFFSTAAARAGQPAPLLPQDAGHLTLAASQTLALQGTLLTAAGTTSGGSPAGRSAEIDITGRNIAVVDQTGRGDVGPDFLQIAAADLTKINGSVLLGGTRVDTAGGVTVTPSAADIIVVNSAASPLDVPELMLAATDAITVQRGAVISGSGSGKATPLDVTIDPSAGGAGAFIRASNSGPVTVTRPAPLDASAGTATIQAGATLGADGSLLIDATRDTVSSGQLKLAPGAALSLASSSISLGDAPAAQGGLVLDATQLGGFASLGSLVLKSYGTIDVYGSGVALGGAVLGNLTFDTGALVGHAGNDGGMPTFAATAGTLNLIDSAATSLSAAAAAVPAGRLALNATTLVVGAGDKTIAGFAAVDLNAAGELQAQGSGTLQVAGALGLSATRIAGLSGANQTWSAVDASGHYDNVTLSAPTKRATLPATDGLGARLTIAGAAIDAAAGVDIVAPSGSVTLAAHGSDGGVHLAAGATVDASGAAKDFQGTTAIADAGSVTLTSDRGTIALDAGSTLDVAGASQGGNAGTLAISGTSVALNGTLAGAAKAGAQQGTFNLDTGTLADFSALNAQLNQGGFTESRDLRVRSGSVTVAASDKVQSHHTTISADTGAIVVDGTIDASASGGAGSVALNAGTGLTLAAGSLIDASGTATATDATAPYVDGGSVALYTASGTLAFASGATVDVSGGAKGQAGQVSLTAPRVGNEGIAADLQGRVLSRSHDPGAAAAAVDVEANQVHTVGSTLSSDDIAGFAAENHAFMAAVDAAGIAAHIAGDDGKPQGNVHVRPALELQASGDLRLDDATTIGWDLTDPSAWLLANNASATLQAGTLTIRAAGDLTISNISLGLPDNNLHAGDTWNIQLVGGADLTAANRLQTQSAEALGGKGNVLLDGPNARVTSGTGSIAIAAGHDFQINSNTGVVYTSGAPAVDTVEGGYGRVDQDSFGLWAQGGGNITITAGHDAIGTSSEWITDWYRRTVSVQGASGSWWTYRSNFQDNVGALGGGNVTIAAGHDVNDLSAMIPTTGRVYSPSPLTVQQGRNSVLGPGPFFLDVEGGGNLSVTAGNDVTGGEYLVALGSGSIKAGGQVGGAVPTQLYLMGESNDPARQGASLAVAAGGAINLQSISDPTALTLTQSIGDDPSITFNGQAANFLSYSTNSAVRVDAKSGDLTIAGTLATKPTLNPDEFTSAGQGVVNNDVGTSIQVLPAKVSLVAFDGSISASPSETLAAYPSATGGLTVLAGKDIGVLQLQQLSSATSGTGAVSSWSATTTATDTGDLIGLQGPLTKFTPSSQYVDDVVALGGGISDAGFIFPAVSRLWADGNISNVTASLQNTQSTDVSEIVANTGFIHPGTQAPNTTIAGPGRLLMQAGSDIDLGAVSSGSAGVLAIGNNLNPFLPDATSARLTLVAGVTGSIALDQLDAAYAALIQAGTNNKPDDAAAAMAKVFGKAKINPGNIYSYLTSIETQQGSDMDLLAPGGNVTVGLTTPPGSTTVGLVTDAGGAIRSYLSGDFDINQGKVLTAQGGDILIYTTKGSIDAGRGAKTSVTTPAPQRVPVVDSNGVITGFIYKVAASAAGSGIQTVTSSPGPGLPAPPAGNIYLFAPAGTIDAGEAGIVSGGNIVIAAQTVLNASNISSQGTSVGVPEATSGSLAATVASTTGPVGTAATQAAADAARNAANAATTVDPNAFKTSILTVEVLGFGEKNCKENQKDCFAK